MASLSVAGSVEEAKGYLLPDLREVQVVNREKLLSLNHTFRELEAGIPVEFFNSKTAQATLLEILDEAIRDPRSEVDVPMKDKLLSLMYLSQYALSSPVGRQLLSAEKAKVFEESFRKGLHRQFELGGEVTGEELPEERVGPVLLSMTELLFFHYKSQAVTLGDRPGPVQLSTAKFKEMVEFIKGVDCSDKDFLLEVYSRLLSTYLTDEEEAALSEEERDNRMHDRSLRPCDGLPSVVQIAQAPLQHLHGYLFLMATHQRHNIFAQMISQRAKEIVDEANPIPEKLFNKAVYFTQIGGTSGRFKDLT